MSIKIKVFLAFVNKLKKGLFRAVSVGIFVTVTQKKSILTICQNACNLHI